MSKIVIDAREYSTSTGRYISRLIQYLQADQTNSEHDYVILLTPSDMNAYQPSSPRFSKVACPYKEFTFGEQLGLLGLIKELRPDLVHFGATQQPIGYRGLSVTTMHDLTTARFRNPSKNQLAFRFKQQVYKGVIKYVAGRSAAILVPSEFVKQDIIKYTRVLADKITVTYEAADAIDDVPETVKLLVGKRFIMYVGRPMLHKNLGRLLDAFTILKAARPELFLVLAGKTDRLYEQYYAEVQQRGLADVLFTGYVSEGQLHWLYENCQAYIFPSLSEGFGLPGLEAMRHGAAVVSSKASCLPEIYGAAAEYFDPYDVNDIAAHIERVLHDPLLRRSLVAAGSRQVERYSWQRMTRQTLKVYNDVLQKPKF